MRSRSSGYAPNANSLYAETMRIALLTGVAILAASCSSENEKVAVPIGSIIATKGALDGVNKLTLSVFDAATVKCNEDPKSAQRGQVTGDQSKPLATTDLATMGCMPPAKYCGNIQVEKSGAQRTIVAAGFVGNTLRASGCVTAVIDKDQLKQDITVYRVLPPAVCGGKPSMFPQVQCAAPGSDTDFVCDANCLSKEMYISKGSEGAQQTFDSKDKVRPSFVWPASGDKTEGRFVAFFGDTSPSGRFQVSMRVLSPDLAACKMNVCEPYYGTDVENYSFFIPNNKQGPAGGLWTGGDTAVQFQPAATFANGQYFVAFEDGGPTRIALRSYDSFFRSGQDPNAAIGLSMTGTGHKLPAIAASQTGKVLVVWQAGDGNIRGRTVDTNGLMLGAEQTYGMGTKPSVAGTPNGFVVAWQSGADIKLKSADASGTPGMEIKVNDATHMGSQESPSVAALSDGKVAVVWVDTGSQGVFVQRYSAALMPVANDQAKRINDLTTAAAQPTIVAGSNGAVPFFAAAWVDTATNHVRARFLDGTGGFLFNPVSGQSSEFQASREDGPTRANPTVAIGGAGPYVIIGWEDNTGGASGQICKGTGGMPPVAGSCKGIFARRFPVPTN